MNYLYVPKCLSCGVKVDFNKYLCDTCSLKWNCERKSVEQNDLFLAYYSKKYDSVAKIIVLKMKNSNEKRYYKFVADEFYDKLIKYQNYMITNVPRAKSKINEFGHDQAKLLAKAIAAKMNLKYQEFLTHIGNKQQKSLNVEDRLLNASSSFEIKRKFVNSLHGLNILLVDDVLTTGATLDICKRLLIENGANDVKLITVCRTK